MECVHRGSSILVKEVDEYRNYNESFVNNNLEMGLNEIKMNDYKD